LRGIHPGGCDTCTSGIDRITAIQFAELITVDLDV
jgi:hypothetical protein